MDTHNDNHPPTKDHSHTVGDPTVRYDIPRGHGYHRHVGTDLNLDNVRRVRAATTDVDDLLISAWPHNDQSATSIIRTVNHWNPDGTINFPCQFGYHAGLKYNVVQLHHKWPIGLGGPVVDLRERDCGWNTGLPGLGACGMHHDDVHLLWRLLGKALHPLEPFYLLTGMRRKFGHRVVDGVEQGWNLRIAWMEANPEKGS